MRCRECDTPNPPERARCSKCGAKLPLPPGRTAKAEEGPPTKPRRQAEVVEELDEIEEVKEVKEAPRARKLRKEDDDRPLRGQRRRVEDEEEDDDEYEEDESTVARIIPYHNAMALIGYYCAMASLIPAVIYPLVLIGFLETPGPLAFLEWLLPLGAIVLGGAALVLGILGIVQARNNPRAKGGGHAGFALFVGLLAFLIGAVGWILWGAGVLPLKLFAP